MDPLPTHLYTLTAHRGDDRQVVFGIRSSSASLAQHQATRAAWHDPRVVDARPLRADERVETCIDDVLDDDRFGSAWVPFVVALETWVGYLENWPSFDAVVLRPENDYSRKYPAPQWRVTGQFPFSKKLWISTSKRAGSDHPGIATIEKNGWMPPSSRFNLGHQRPLPSGTPVSRAVFWALSGMAHFMPITPDVVFDFFNHGEVHTPGLELFHPVTHGDETYYQIPSEASVVANRTTKLLSSPTTSHVYRRLTPEDREGFISRWKDSYPDCHTWSDDTIHYWVAFGG